MIEEQHQGISGLLNKLQSEAGVSNLNLSGLHEVLVDWYHGRRARSKPQKILVNNYYEFVQFKF